MNDESQTFASAEYVNRLLLLIKKIRLEDFSSS